MYNLNRINGEVWVCEKRGECNARINTRNYIIIKPTDIIKLANDHTHAPSQERIFWVKLKCYVSLAFVPEIDVIDYFNILMQNFPENALSVANYFENT